MPYPGISGRELLGHLLRGDRLYQPSVTSSEMSVDSICFDAFKNGYQMLITSFLYRYEIMKTCWEFSPKGRPSFKDLESTLESYLEERLVRTSFLPTDNIKGCLQVRFCTLQLSSWCMY